MRNQCQLALYSHRNQTDKRSRQKQRDTWCARDARAALTGRGFADGGAAVETVVVSPRAVEVHADTAPRDSGRWVAVWGPVGEGHRPPVRPRPAGSLSIVRFTVKDRGAKATGRLQIYTPHWFKYVQERFSAGRSAARFTVNDRCANTGRLEI